ncbi:MAG: 1-deoxy-D-xylulose-5-phosphate synthase [Moraxellaceae bacterium]|nr:MAG: 1-deoxy-D-xylulose-5-phosphate synthase [Moraxellaceae bacterium]
MFHKIPSARPSTPLLDVIDAPEQLRLLPQEKLPQLAKELREFLLYSVGKSGGHFGAGLGVVELTIALHYVYNTPEDKIVWDVGHQAYPHKILTGRREQLSTIRQKDGLAAFPRLGESIYDTFGVGHSSTSIGAAQGMSIGAKMSGKDSKSIAVIGDGAMTAGMAFEALNHAAHERNDMLVVLNDNRMSISHNVGGLSNYLSRVWSSRLYTSVREGSKKILANFPDPATELVRKTEAHMKGMVSPATLFEELGFNYIGPIDGHDIETLLSTLENIRHLKGPQILHLMTTKGKGFIPAEEDPIGYHAINKIEPSPPVRAAQKQPSAPKYQDVFGQWICDMASQDKRLVGITPAMREGSGLVEFSKRFPSRYYDVAIAEQHALTLAAGIACEQQKPVVAIYSTFLQRAYDQLIHDIALQNLDVTFAIDRAGLVGADGPTHAGSFDLSYMRCIPNMVIMAPSDENECRQMLYTGYQYQGPAAIRYPRGKGLGVKIEEKMQALPIGKANIRRQGKQIAILAFGSMLKPALEAASSFDATVVDMRFIKPLDQDLISQLALEYELLITIEENAVSGGAGSAVTEHLNQQGILVPVLQLGLPDYFVEHAKPEQMLTECGLDKTGIEKSISARLALLKNNQDRPANKLA